MNFDEVFADVVSTMCSILVRCGFGGCTEVFTDEWRYQQQNAWVISYEPRVVMGQEDLGRQLHSDTSYGFSIPWVEPEKLRVG